MMIMMAPALKERAYTDSLLVRPCRAIVTKSRTCEKQKRETSNPTLRVRGCEQNGRKPSRPLHWSGDRPEAHDGSKIDDLRPCFGKRDRATRTRPDQTPDGQSMNGLSTNTIGSISTEDN